MLLQVTPAKLTAVLFLCTLAACTHAFGDRRYDADGGLGDSADGGDGGACNSPPANVCLDQTALRVQVAVGTSNAGACSYDHWDVLCENGCQNGACVGNDPCDGVMCIKPPMATCSDSATLKSYAASGTCSAGVCSYSSTSTTCGDGCVNGMCTGDPCAGISCTNPPTATCSDANTRRSYAAGTCSAGNCSYASIDTSCAHGCANGACNNDLCAGVTCTQSPAASCLDANTQRSYSSPGTCSNGSCSYPTTNTTCASGCANGVCTGSPCAGVFCFNPPSGYCVDSNTLRQYQFLGQCTGSGTCSYPTTDTVCSDGCVNGACQCTPNCSGQVCGSNDGCGGQCMTGSCSDPKKSCQNGVCACTPACSGVACGGGDGCGGLCFAACSGGCSSACTGNTACVSGQCLPSAAYLSDCVSTGCHALPCQSGYREIPTCDATPGESTPLCLRNEITQYWTENDSCPSGTHAVWWADDFTICSSGPAPGGGYIYFDVLCVRDQ